MGVIKFFKKVFGSKVISLPVKRRDVLIQPHSSGYTTINLGQKLAVDNGWAAVIVAKDEVLDVFMEGVHEVSLAYIPKTTKHLKLDKGKVRKNGVVAEVVLPKNFKCDLYYVRMDYIQGRKWESDLVKVREREKKSLKYKMTGNYSFQVQAPDKAVRLFLIEWGKINTGKAITRLDGLVSEICSDVLWHKKVKSKDELTQYDFGNQVLKPSVYKNFIKYGICVADMQVEKIIYPEIFGEDKYQQVTPEKVGKKTEYHEVIDDRIDNLKNIETSIEFQRSKDKESDNADTKTGKIPFYDFNDTEKKNNAYKTPNSLEYKEEGWTDEGTVLTELTEDIKSQITEDIKSQEEIPEKIN